jgi:hypothetical protein
MWSRRSSKLVSPARAITDFTHTLYFPPRITSALIEQQLPGRVLVSAAWYRVAAPHLGGTIGPYYYSGPGAGQPQAYGRVDLRVARKLKMGDKEVELAVVAQSLGGAYDEFQPGVQFGRRLFASAAIEF